MEKISFEEFKAYVEKKQGQVWWELRDGNIIISFDNYYSVAEMDIKTAYNRFYHNIMFDSPLVIGCDNEYVL